MMVITIATRMPTVRILLVPTTVHVTKDLKAMEHTASVRRKIASVLTINASERRIFRIRY